MCAHIAWAHIFVQVYVYINNVAGNCMRLLEKLKDVPVCGTIVSHFSGEQNEGKEENNCNKKAKQGLRC